MIFFKQFFPPASLEPVSPLDAEDSSQDVDTTDFHTVADVTPFPEVSYSL